MKGRKFIAAILAALVAAGCARQLPGGAMEYSTTFERSIPAGQSLPGTDIKYIGKTEQGAEMSLGGQMATKRTLDSLTWRGEPVPGVKVDYNLRIITFDARSLHAAGTAKVVVSDAKPKAVSLAALSKDALKFTGAVSYDVPQDKTIPGTTITYDGKTPDGAKLGGMEGYALRKEADSVLWSGQLTDKVFLELDLRVVYFNDSSLKLAGTASLYMTP